MSLNEIYKPGKALPITVPAGVVSGDVVVVDQLIGVARIDRQSDGIVTIDTEGVFELTVTGAVTLGQAIYAVVAGGLVTGLNTTASGNTRIGTAITAQAATGKVYVRLRQP